MKAPEYQSELKTTGVLERVTIDCNPLHPENASYPIALTEEGITIEVKAEQLKKARLTIVSTVDGNTESARFKVRTHDSLVCFLSNRTPSALE